MLLKVLVAEQHMCTRSTYMFGTFSHRFKPSVIVGLLTKEETENLHTNVAFVGNVLYWAP